MKAQFDIWWHLYRKLLKLYCPYLNCSNIAKIRLSFSINLFFQVQPAQVSPLMMPAPSSPQKYWDELSQPPCSKGKDLLIQNIVTANEVNCGMLVIPSPKTFWCLLLVLQNISWSRDNESWSGGDWSHENWSHDTKSKLHGWYRNISKD